MKDAEPRSLAGPLRGAGKGALLPFLAGIAIPVAILIPLLITRKTADPSPLLAISRLEEELAPLGVGFERGLTSAPHVIVEVVDFGCAFCSTLNTWTGSLIDEAVASGQARHRLYIVNPEGTPASRVAATFAHCVAEQSKDVWLFRAQALDLVGGFPGNDPLSVALLEAALAEAAEGLEASSEPLEDCVEAMREDTRFVRAFEAGLRQGLTVLPVIAVDGRPLYSDDETQLTRDLRRRLGLASDV